jgi:cell division septation protein DedD
MKLTTLLICISLVAGLACAPREFVNQPTEVIPLYPGYQPVCQPVCPPGPCPMVGGYSVQIYAFLDPGRAQRAVCCAQQQGLPATVDFSHPYFKVRVGSYMNRWQAERLRQKAIALGYYDAFVVSAPCR